MTSQRRGVTTRDEAHDAHERGLVHVARGDSESARACFLRALELDPTRAKSAANLARLALDARDPENALAFAERAVSIEPSPRYATLCAQSLIALKRHQAAISMLEESLARDSAQSAAWSALATAYRETMGPFEAGRCLQRAVQVLPNDGRLWNNLGTQLASEGRDDEAVAAYERAAALLPNDIAVLTNLGAALLRTNRLAAAEQALSHALAIASRSDEATSLLWVLKAQSLRTREVVSDWSVDHPPGIRSHAARLFVLAHSDDVEPAELRRETEDWALAHLAAVEPAARSATRLRRSTLRVGYLSSDLRSHVVPRFIGPVCEAHQRHGIEVFLLSTTTSPDAVTRALAQSTPLVQLDPATPAQTADAIRGLDLDAIVELNGLTDRDTLAIVGRQVAPVQLTYLGFPSTTGLRCLDGRITDAWADPPGVEGQFTEPLIRLKRCAWAYRPPELKTAPGPRPAGPIRFGCFNRTEKFSRPLIACWRELLERAPGARLVLRARALRDASVRSRFLDLLGHDLADRVELREWDPDPMRALSAYAEVDVALDTYPYHGTTTTCDALWMGLAVVSWQGRWPASRVGRSLLVAAGLDDLAVSTPEQYVEKALELADDHERRARLRADAIDRMTASPLGDPDGLASALERMYVERLYGD